MRDTDDMDADQIKALLRERGLTQKAMADYLGLDPSAVTRLLRGERRLRLDEAQKLETFFGGPAQAQPNVAARANWAANPNPDGAPRDLPVYGSAQGGPEGMTIDYQPIEWMRRPPNLEGVVDAFAFYVVGDSMEPRFRQGERLLVHPKRPPRPGEDVLLILKPDAEGAEVNAMVKTLVALTSRTAKVAQYNPEAAFEIDRDRIAGLLLIVGAYYYD